MDMKKHMLLYFFIYMLVDKGKNERYGSYKMDVIIRKAERLL
jgi:hypothetical protein